MSKEEMTEVLEAIEGVAKHIGRFDPPMQPNYLVLSLGNQVDTLRRLISEQDQGEPVEFLANGVRFKLNFDSKGRVSSLWNYLSELDGRWVALVAAEDDCHLRYTHPQPTQPTTSDDREFWIGVCEGLDKAKASKSPTADMTLRERIAHVGGRENAAGYIEFGSAQAVKVLIEQVLRDTQPAQPKEQLTVRLVSYPESNGRKNWTAMFVRTQPWDGLRGNAGGITIDRGECWNRVAYNAERARFLLGERTTEPNIMAYGKDVKTPEEWDGTDSEAAHGIKE